MTNRPYLQTDTLDDALSSLELALSFYDLAQQDDRYWKWFVVALHSGTQGIFAAALGSPSSLIVQKPGITKQMAVAFADRAVPPPPHMDNFMRLYIKMQNAANLCSSEALPLPASPEHKNGLEKLDELRDDFLHFNSKSWLISKEVLVSSARTAAQVVRFVLLEGNAVRMYESEERLRATQVADKLAQRLSVDA